MNLYQSLWQRLFLHRLNRIGGRGGTNHKVDYIQSPFEVRKILTTRMKANHEQGE
ncbi:MAG: hypothetical protein L6U16_03895 [Porphyromonadaceae bacterium]|nr:MAG: hypothetical protein L6U16_03895 [Porphyromonadaceae bacterium]